MIEFSDFELHSTDVLVIYEGDMDNSNILGLFSDLEGDIPPNIISLGQIIGWFFFTNSADTARGFEFTTSYIDRKCRVSLQEYGSYIYLIP